MSKLTEDELEGLTKEEREAIEEDEDVDTSNIEVLAKEETAPPAAKKEDEEVVSQDEEVGTKAAEEVSVAPKEDVVVAKVEETPAEELEVEIPNVPTFVPQYDPVFVEDYDNRVKKIADDLKALDKQEEELDKAADAGDKSTAEARKEEREITRRRLELSREQSNLEHQQATAIREAEQNDKMSKAFWDHEQQVFFDSHPEYFVTEKDAEGNDVMAPDVALTGALDGLVRKYARENPNKSGTWALHQAHKVVMEKFMKKETPVVETKAEQKPKVVEHKKPVPSRQPDLKSVPKTLAKVPAAADADVGKDTEFSHLDDLSGVEFEQALAKLTDDQRARYEAA